MNDDQGAMDRTDPSPLAVPGTAHGGATAERMLADLVARIRDCRICAPHLPLEPRPVVRPRAGARILIAGHAPSRAVHETRTPWNDPSGDRLRDWLGIDRETFYGSDRIAIVPMGFCYPGTVKGAGDNPPRPECAATWHGQLVPAMRRVELTLCLGRYAIDWHLGQRRGRTLTDTVADWQSHWPRYLPLPHPSGRNNGWLARNRWFEADVLPVLRSRVAALLA
ncbi:MAG: uracil-DNA glycosylase family protein [Pseudomonadota bacterium]|nr:uracil-DNA glycosylase family protein [Pseudomonadota bacterium]